MEQTSNINSTHHYGKPMLSEGLLIPMTEFVLNIDKLVPKDGDQFFESWQNEKLIITYYNCVIFLCYSGNKMVNRQIFP